MCRSPKLLVKRCSSLKNVENNWSSIHSFFSVFILIFQPSFASWVVVRLKIVVAISWRDNFFFLFISQPSIARFLSCCVIEKVWSNIILTHFFLISYFFPTIHCLFNGCLMENSFDNIFVRQFFFCFYTNLPTVLCFFSWSCLLLLELPLIWNWKKV